MFWGRDFRLDSKKGCGCDGLMPATRSQARAGARMPHARSKSAGRSERLAIEGGPKAVRNKLPVDVPNARWHEAHTFTCFGFPTYFEQDMEQIAAARLKVLRAYSV